MCVLDWKTSGVRRDRVRDLYDYPIQLAAYRGALLSPRYFADLRFGGWGEGVGVGKGGLGLWGGVQLMGCYIRRIARGAPLLAGVVVLYDSGEPGRTGDGDGGMSTSMALSACCSPTPKHRCMCLTKTRAASTGPSGLNAWRSSARHIHLWPCGTYRCRARRLRREVCVEKGVGWLVSGGTASVMSNW